MLVRELELTRPAIDERLSGPSRVREGAARGGDMKLVLWECPFKMSVALMQDYDQHAEYPLEVVGRPIDAERNSACDSSLQRGSFCRGCQLERSS
jgi:hypothetical protein